MSSADLVFVFRRTMLIMLVALVLISDFLFPEISTGRCGSPVGSSHHRHENKIVGGYDMGFYKYPWYAALVHKKFVECGGALVTSKNVLTAAHCFDSIKSGKVEEYFTVKLGVYNVCVSENTQVEFKVESVKIHELYSKTNPYNDIAVMTLVKSADKFMPICLPKTFVKNRPKEGFVPGLGTLSYRGATPCTLHEARILIYPDDNCKSMLNAVEKNVSNLEKAFCAGYIQGGIDTCQGDSGGPFQIADSNGIYNLLGIVSFGYKCADPGVLGIYTDVSQHLDWIRRHVSKEQTDENDSATESSGSTTNSVNIPSILGVRPHQFLQYFPFRPSLQVQIPQINIFINAKRKSKKKSGFRNKKPQQ